METINDISEAHGVSVVVVGSENCVACKQLKTKIEKAEIDARYIDIEDVADFLNRQPQKVRSLPVTIIFKNGKVNNMLTGNVSIDKIKQACEG